MSSTVEKENRPFFSLLTSVKLYFTEVINAQNFVIAVDRSGVYFFSMETDHDWLLIKASEYMEDLALERKQIIICSVSDDAEITKGNFFSYEGNDKYKDMLVVDINIIEFEDMIRRLVGSRPNCLSQQDILSILECFDSIVRKHDSLEEKLVRAGLPKEVRERLVMYVPDTIPDVIDCGVPKNKAAEIYNILMDEQVLTTNKDYSHKHYLAINDKEVNNYIALSIILSLCSFIALAFQIWWVALPLSVFGILFGHRVALLFKTFWSTLCSTFGWCAFIIAVVLVVWNNSSAILDFLISSGLLMKNVSEGSI